MTNNAFIHANKTHVVVIYKIFQYYKLFFATQQWSQQKDQENKHKSNKNWSQKGIQLTLFQFNKDYAKLTILMHYSYDFSRSKVKGQNDIYIEDLNARKVGNIFEGYVLVVYKATLDQVNKSRLVLHADLTNSKAEMTIIVNVTGDLVEKYEEKIVPNSAITILGFDIAPKIDYDHRDCDCILILKDSTTIKTLPCICQEYNFIQSTTIYQLRIVQMSTPLEQLVLW